MKTDLHPRNRHQGQYDFVQLINNCRELANFVTKNAYGNDSIDFADPLAVKTLNKSLLKTFYNITWDIPEPFLCPPIPSRANYIHSIADLLMDTQTGIIPSKKITILDIGVGANCIYPLIGAREYGWNFIGTDTDPEAIAIANEIIMQNGLQDSIKLRLQKSPNHIFQDILQDSVVQVTMCNPPFHASESEAKAARDRKWRNLRKTTTALNFGGKSSELWYPGGEVAFIRQMIIESVNVSCNWFTSLVSKETSLSPIYQTLDDIKASVVKTIPFGQGQKRSRIIAWKVERKA